MQSTARWGDPAIRRSRWVWLALAACWVARPTLAQNPDSLKKAKSDSASKADSIVSRVKAQQILITAPRVQLWQAAAVVGGVGLISLADKSVTNEVQRHRSTFLGHVSTVFRQQGEPWYYITVSLGVFGTGMVVGSPDIRRAGRRLVASVAASGLTTYAIKMLVGRSRPNEGVGAYNFHPFSTLKDSAGIEARGSFPSGHTTAAFAVATSLAEDIHNPIASVALYTIAAGAAWSRIYDTRHWLSDTVFGAALGITTAKVVSGRWRIFGWKPPAFMVRPTGSLSMEWSVPLSPIRLSGPSS